METNFTRLEKLEKSGEVKFENFILDKNVITRTWGIQNKVIQITDKTYSEINTDKENVISAEKAAKKDYFRMIKKKIKEEYRIISSDTHLASGEIIYAND